MTQIELIPFIPETASYQIWHSKDFLVNEDEDGIVTITSPETDSNLTLSSYQVNQQVTETMLIDFFHDSTKNYIRVSEEKSIITDNRIWLEGEFRKENIFWVWWALSHSNQIILASVNSKNMLSPKIVTYIYSCLIKWKYILLISMTERRISANMRFSAMLAEEYILIDISLSAAVRAERINLSKRI